VVEQGEREDTEFLKDSEEKGVTIDLKNSEKLKNVAATSE